MHAETRFEAGAASNTYKASNAICATQPACRNLVPHARVVSGFLADEFRLDPVIPDYDEA